VLSAYISWRSTGALADARQAQEVLGWLPQFTDIEDVIRTAWNWHRNDYW